MKTFEPFIDLVHSLDDRAMLEDLLISITTPSERLALSQRLEIVKRLLRKEPHAKIAKELRVGVATVTRGSKELTAGKFKALRSK